MSVRTRPSTRMWIPRDNPAVYKALVALQRVSSAGVDAEIGELISMRVSQLNGCAYCLHMHAGDALAAQIDPHKLLMLPAWPEAGAVFDARERAVLALAEQLTLLGDREVTDGVFDDVRAHFDAVETGQLVAAIAMINTWNRIAIAGGYPAGLDERRASVTAG
ncbi:MULTISPECIES: carboxymuconolactone decarboxylase family protein [Gordonia]|uniref:Carboxymuconolactone decarboxylase family protein n=1 Tax=Gordonia amicalis TaxID=89053 RepID=A0ABU4DAS4_9ACTN|nr:MULTISPECIES: carboxymuconolactone decarboxylase family protein [Gordonia]MBA5849169.1 carboxymuconolactone decarboxylase family protein [Gordonia amicalis]MDJ0454127.1 carboxymuconolactone decarboxylase family protein [Gordonia amicalis]MDV6306775.1 carboxymuconolactone decarboxylase family protein [Gordonia amicalis]MDV7077271.1 carboxymuconolactone decarboxylase family protein [Gordonia amicalis]MDV7099095.1 carboxymuconolactone decarboxylase family protein [Gordonia amicalis]